MALLLSTCWSEVARADECDAAIPAACDVSVTRDASSVFRVTSPTSERSRIVSSCATARALVALWCALQEPMDRPGNLAEVEPRSGVKKLAYPAVNSAALPRQSGAEHREAVAAMITEEPPAAWELGVMGGLDVGTLGPASAFATIAYARQFLERGYWRTSIRLLFPQSHSYGGVTVDAGGAEISLAAGLLLWENDSFRLFATLGQTLGMVWAAGALPTGQEGIAWISATQLSMRLAAWLSSTVGVATVIGGRVAWSRPAYAVAGGREIHKAPPVGLFVGLEVFWGRS